MCTLHKILRLDPSKITARQCTNLSGYKVFKGYKNIVVVGPFIYQTTTTVIKNVKAGGGN